MESVIAPGFLVAAPHMRDPYFEKTVVFMMEHDDGEGSMGLVINRKAEVDLWEVLSEIGVSLPDPVNLAEHPPLLNGGPVAPELGWIIHSPEWKSEGTRTFDIPIGVTASLDILEAVARGEGPQKYLFCLGYAGWGPGQLVNEIKAGAWITVPFKEELVFSKNLEEKWTRAIESLGIDPQRLAPLVGDA